MSGAQESGFVCPNCHTTDTEYFWHPVFESLLACRTCGYGETTERLVPAGVAAGTAAGTTPAGMAPQSMDLDTAPERKVTYGGFGAYSLRTHAGGPDGHFESLADRDAYVAGFDASAYEQPLRYALYTVQGEDGQWQRVWQVGSEAVIDFRPVGVHLEAWVHPAEADEDEAAADLAQVEGVYAARLREACDQRGVTLSVEDACTRSPLVRLVGRTPALLDEMRALERALAIRPLPGLRNRVIALAFPEVAEAARREVAARRRTARSQSSGGTDADDHLDLAF